MVIRIPSIQIPEYWEIIKFCATEVDELYKDHRQRFLADLLLALLGDKAQCWMRSSDDRHITSIMLTKINFNKITKENYLQMTCAYSFRPVDDETWKEDCELIKQFANKVQSSYIYFYSSNKRVWGLAKLLGCEEKFRVFALDVR